MALGFAKTDWTRRLNIPQVGSYQRGQARRLRIRGHDDDALCPQRVDLCRASLWVLFRTADARHHRQMSTGGLRLTSRLPNRWEKFADGVGMGAIAEDEVEQDDGRRGILRGFENPFAAQRAVDHWMRTADGEAILAQVDHGMAFPSS
jgi:hypothetical protein